MRYNFLISSRVMSRSRSSYQYMFRGRIHCHFHDFFVAPWWAFRYLVQYHVMFLLSSLSLISKAFFLVSSRDFSTNFNPAETDSDLEPTDWCTMSDHWWFLIFMLNSYCTLFILAFMSCRPYLRLNVLDFTFCWPHRPTLFSSSLLVSSASFCTQISFSFVFFNSLSTSSWRLKYSWWF